MWICADQKENVNIYQYEIENKKKLMKDQNEGEILNYEKSFSKFYQKYYLSSVLNVKKKETNKNRKNMYISFSSKK